jgi:hypothetical protein
MACGGPAEETLGSDLRGDQMENISTQTVRENTWWVNHAENPLQKQSRSKGLLQ